MELDSMAPITRNAVEFHRWKWLWLSNIALFMNIICSCLEFLKGFLLPPLITTLPKCQTHILKTRSLNKRFSTFKSKRKRESQPKRSSQTHMASRSVVRVFNSLLQARAPLVHRPCKCSRNVQPALQHRPLTPVFKQCACRYKSALHSAHSMLWDQPYHVRFCCATS